jgi:spore coat protein H
MRFASSLFVLLFLACTPVPGLAEAAPVSRKPVPGLDLFEKGEIPRVRLELSGEAIQSLRTSPRKYVVGAVVEGTRRYTNVSIRLKGGPGSSRPLEDRPAFTVNFDRQATGQTFHGLKKLHLNNSVQDSSYLSEKLCREMFEACSRLPAYRPRAPVMPSWRSTIAGSACMCSSRASTNSF